MNRVLKGIIVGAGYMGRNHIRILRGFSDVDLVGVAETQATVAANIARMYGIDTFRSLDQALLRIKQKIDFAIIAAPTSRHFSLVKKCLERGIVTLVEKPIAETVSQAKRLVNLAEVKNIPMMVGHVERFNPAVAELKKRLERGDLGRVFQVWVDRLGPFPGRVSDVGVVIDLSTHDLDMFEYLVGDGIVKVTARVERFFHPGHEDFLMGLIDFKNGAKGMLNVNWITPRKVRRLSITGKRGMYVLNYLTQELFFYKNNVSKIEWEQMEMFKAVNEGDMIKIKIDYQEPLALELRAFIDCVKNRRPMPVGSASALRALELANSMLKSGKSGKSISV